MTASLHTEQLQQRWLDICLEKFDGCFIDNAVLARALNTRESIGIRQDGALHTNRITPSNLDQALKAIDAADTAVFQLGDSLRHGNILEKRLGADLLAKLALSPAEILIYEAVYFYSASDDAYMINTLNRHEPKKFEVYFEIGLDGESLDYSIQDQSGMYSGHIDSDQLLQAHITFDRSANAQALRLQLAPRLPDLLTIISTLDHRHVDLMIAQSFMQYFIYRMECTNDYEQIADIMEEKAAFAASVETAITLRIAMKIYQKLQNNLFETFDSVRFAAFHHTALPHLSSRTMFDSVDAAKTALHQLIDLDHDMQAAISQQIEAYHQAKAQLSLKLEGLPQLLKIMSEEKLTLVTEIEQAGNLASLAFGLTELLYEASAKIQQETEETQTLLQDLTQSLNDFLSHPAVVESWKMAIRPLLRNPNAALTLNAAKEKIKEMQQCQFEIEHLLKQQKQRYLVARDHLQNQLKRKVPMTHAYRNGERMMQTALNHDALDTAAWKIILDQTEKMEELANALQNRVAYTTSILPTFGMWTIERPQLQDGDANTFDLM